MRARLLALIWPVPPACAVLLAVNWLVFILLEASGSTLDTAYLIRWGALSDMAVWSGELYRPFTAMFLHSGLLHIVVNSLGILLACGIAEKYLGALRFSILYFAGGYCSSLASLLFSPSIASVGASGAIFAGFSFFFMRLLGRLEGERLVLGRRFWLVFLFAVGADTAFGLLVVGNVDVAGHLGGALAGLALGRLLIPRRPGFLATFRRLRLIGYDVVEIDAGAILRASRTSGAGRENRESDGDRQLRAAPLPPHAGVGRRIVLAPRLAVTRGYDRPRIAWTAAGALVVALFSVYAVRPFGSSRFQLLSADREVLDLRLDRARRRLGELLGSGRLATLVHYRLALLDLHEGRTLRAIEHLEQALARRPDPLGEDLFDLLIEASRAEPMTAGQRRLRERIASQLERGESSLPGFAQDNNQAWYLTETGGDLVRALALARRSVAVRQLSFNLDTLGWVHYHRREYSQAEEALAQAIRKDPAPDLLIHMGMIQLRLGRTELARGYLERATRASRSLWDLRLFLKATKLLSSL